MLCGYTHIDIISPNLKSRKSIIDVGSFSFYNESTIASKNVIQIITAPDALRVD
jgi:hypothetical protein